MAQRRPLTEGLSIVPPGAADPEAVRAFVKQEPQPEKREEPKAEAQPVPAETSEPEVVTKPVEEVREAKTSAKPRRAKKGPMPVGLIPVTVRLKPEIAGALKRASLERQLAGEDVYTQQDLVEEALEPWLRENGYLL